MSVKGLSKEYAEALYQVAVDQWVKQLSSAEERLRLGDAIATLDNPAIEFARKEQIITEALPDAEADQARRFLLLLARKNHVRLLPDIVARFRHMTRRGVEARETRVTSAVPLSPQEEEALRIKLAARFGQDLEFAFVVDPSILGGVVVRVGDRVIDGSVAGQLASLKNSLSEVA